MMSLMLSMLGKVSADNILEYFFFLFPDINFGISSKLSLRDNLHNMPKPVLWEK